MASLKDAGDSHCHTREDKLSRAGAALQASAERTNVLAKGQQPTDHQQPDVVGTKPDITSPQAPAAGVAQPGQTATSDADLAHLGGWQLNAQGVSNPVAADALSLGIQFSPGIPSDEAFAVETPLGADLWTWNPSSDNGTATEGPSPVVPGQQQGQSTLTTGDPAADAAGDLWAIDSAPMMPFPTPSTPLKPGGQQQSPTILSVPSGGPTLQEGVSAILQVDEEAASPGAAAAIDALLG